MLSVNQLCLSSKLKCVFSSTACYFQDPQTERKLGEGELIGNLYLLKIPPYTVANAVCNKPLVTWYRCLGHASFNALKHVPFLHKFCTSNDINEVKACDICFKGKQHRMSFGHSTIKTTRIFELVHTDIWGPTRDESLVHPIL